MLPQSQITIQGLLSNGNSVLPKPSRENQEGTQTPVPFKPKRPSNGPDPRRVNIKDRRTASSAVVVNSPFNFLPNDESTWRFNQDDLDLFMKSIVGSKTTTHYGQSFVRNKIWAMRGVPAHVAFNIIKLRMVEEKAKATRRRPCLSQHVPRQFRPKNLDDPSIALALEISGHRGPDIATICTKLSLGAHLTSYEKRVLSRISTGVRKEGGSFDLMRWGPSRKEMAIIGIKFAYARVKGFVLDKCTGAINKGHVHWDTISYFTGNVVKIVTEWFNNSAGLLSELGINVSDILKSPMMVLASAVVILSIDVAVAFALSGMLKGAYLVSMANKWGLAIAAVTGFFSFAIKFSTAREDGLVTKEVGIGHISKVFETLAPNWPRNPVKGYKDEVMFTNSLFTLLNNLDKNFDVSESIKELINSVSVWATGVPLFDQSHRLALKALCEIAVEASDIASATPADVAPGTLERCSMLIQKLVMLETSAVTIAKLDPTVCRKIQTLKKVLTDKRRELAQAVAKNTNYSPPLIVALNGGPGVGKSLITTLAVPFLGSKEGWFGQSGSWSQTYEVGLNFQAPLSEYVRVLLLQDAFQDRSPESVQETCNLIIKLGEAEPFLWESPDVETKGSTYTDFKYVIITYNAVPTLLPVADVRALDRRITGGSWVVTLNTKWAKNDKLDMAQVEKCITDGTLWLNINDIWTFTHEGQTINFMQLMCIMVGMRDRGSLQGRAVALFRQDLAENAGKFAVDPIVYDFSPGDMFKDVGSVATTYSHPTGKSQAYVGKIPQMAEKKSHYHPKSKFGFEDYFGREVEKQVRVTDLSKYDAPTQLIIKQILVDESLTSGGARDKVCGILNLKGPLSEDEIVNVIIKGPDGGGSLEERCTKVVSRKDPAIHLWKFLNENGLSEMPVFVPKAGLEPHVAGRVKHCLIFPGFWCDEHGHVGCPNKMSKDYAWKVMSCDLLCHMLATRKDVTEFKFKLGWMWEILKDYGSKVATVPQEFPLLTTIGIGALTALFGAWLSSHRQPEKEKVEKEYTYAGVRSVQRGGRQRMGANVEKQVAYGEIRYPEFNGGHWVQEKLDRANVPVYGFLEGSDKVLSGNLLFIGGRAFVTISHMFDTPITMGVVGYPHEPFKVKVLGDDEKFVEKSEDFQVVRISPYDLAIGLAPQCMPRRPKLWDKISESRAISELKDLVMHRPEIRDKRNIGRQISLHDAIHFSDYETTDHEYMRNAIVIPASPEIITGPGSCGSAVYSGFNGFNSGATPIVGIQAGRNDNLHVTQLQRTHILSVFAEHGVDLEREKVAAEVAIYQSSGLKTLYAFRPVVGELKKSYVIGHNTKNDIARSIGYNCLAGLEVNVDGVGVILTPPDRFPAHFTPKHIVGPEIGQCIHGKMLNVAPTISKSVLDDYRRAAQCIRQQFGKPKENEGVWTVKQSIDGDPAWLIKPIDLTTSAGAPIKFMDGKKAGKGDLVQIVDGVKTPTKMLLDIIELEDEAIRNHVVPPRIVIDDYKVELRDKAKVERPRVINSHGGAQAIDTRRYLYPFLSAMYQLRTRVGCTIGINMLSPEVEVLTGAMMRSLLKVVTDYKDFDVSIANELAIIIIEEIMVPYTMEAFPRYPDREFLRDKVDNLCRTIFENWRTFGGILFENCSGTTSGHPLTTPSNCLINLCNARFYALLYCREFSLPTNDDYYYANNRVFVYGDDYLGGTDWIAEGARPAFGALYMSSLAAKLGMTMTSANKRGELCDTVPFEECNFLSREPRNVLSSTVWRLQLPKLLCIHAYVRSHHGSDIEKFKENARAALNEWVLYGPETFEVVLKKFNEVIQSRNGMPLGIRFDEKWHEYLGGKLTSLPSWKD